MEKEWCVYMLECLDGSLYTGCTNALTERVQAHREGKGAKYTKMKGVKQLVFTEMCNSRSDAQKRECEIKKMSRAAKEHLLDKE